MAINPSETSPAMISSQFAAQSNLLQNELYRILLRQSPWTAGQLDQVRWQDGVGDTGRNLVIEGTVTQAQWDDPITLRSLSTDTPFNLVEMGSTEYNFNRGETILCTPVFDLTQTRMSHQFAQQVNGAVENLVYNVGYTWQERYRSQYIDASTFKLILSNTVIGQDALSGDLTTFPEIMPTGALTSNVMDWVYTLLRMNNAGNDSDMSSGGRPAFAVFTSTETIDAITRSNLDANNRQNVLFTQMGARDRSYLLTQLGAQMAFRGFTYVVDTLNPRYDYNAAAPVGQKWVRILPYVMTQTTTGVRALPNPAYQNAPFEDTVIFNRSVMKSMVIPPTISAGRATFNPQSYMGEVKWVNNPDMLKNWDRTQGLFVARLSNGPMVVKPRHGVVIRHARALVNSNILGPDGKVVGSLLPGVHDSNAISLQNSMF